MFKIFTFILILTTLFFSFSCQKKQPDTLFTQLFPSQTGIDFANNITPDDTLNVLYYMYMYNGAGVGVGDFNGDSLPDIFFSGNQVSCRFYLNKGNFKFEDITEKAGLQTDRWATGVSIADVNADGLLDIYVCVAYNNLWNKSNENLLFVNQGVKDGIPTFKEMAKEYNLADTSYTTQAAFFDYDRDGDLDMYLLNNWLEKESHNRLRPKVTDGSAPNTDKLFRNEGVGTNGHPTFKDVSKEAGIVFDGYGLGVVIADLNKDGWQDIYVSNDFITNDLMYINNGNGTFANKIAESLMHQTYNAMGTDIADYNNDGFADIVVVDMLPEDNKRQKMMMMNANPDRYAMMTGKFLNYQPEFVRNTLQLNNGNGTFSEIGQLAGIDKTDWSWAALLADYDNDGWKDLYITNGYRKDITDLDYITYSQLNVQFGSDDFKRSKKKEMLKEIPEVRIPNYMYRNKGDLTFENVSKNWGIDVPSYSNGAVYADLDNDGDLDLVVNDIDEPALVFQNNADKLLKNNYLKIKLKGNPMNTFGLGAKIELWAEGKMQYQEQSPVRGFESTVDNILHFGLGKAQKVEYLKITWADGKAQILENIMPNKTVMVDYQNAKEMPDIQSVQSKALPPFGNSKIAINFKHQESDHIDFKQQFTLPHKYSQNGFGIAVGDINGDNLEDFYAGGAYGMSGSFFLQGKVGQFQEKKLTIDTLHEDMGVLLFDADNDKDLDLYVVSGGSERLKNIDYYQDRLYLNDGKANFTLAENALPDTKSSGSCVVACDFDKDGDLDLFVGGRVTPNEYPLAPRSYLLRNDTKAASPLPPPKGEKNLSVFSPPREVKFTDITPPELAGIGMVTSALWTDYDNDKQTDLVIVGEFMPITFFRNDNKKLIPDYRFQLNNLNGWWNSISAGDFDNDGDTDYIAGNLGRNTRYQAADNQPVCVYAKDFDKNGMVDAMLCHFYADGKNYLMHPRDNFLEQMIVMRKRFPNYVAYANAPFEKIFGEQDLKDAYIVRANYFATSYIENQGDGKFDIRPLPLEMQFAPVFGTVVNDYNNDGNLDVLMVGNSYAPEVNWGRYDASFGAYLQGDGKGNFKAIPNNDSGLLVKGDAKGMAEICIGKIGAVVRKNTDNRVSGNHPSPALEGAGGRLIHLIAINSEGIKTIENHIVNTQKVISILPNERYAILTLKNGKKRKQEFYWGRTYLSQSSRNLKVNQEVISVEVFDEKGKVRKVDLE